MPCQRAAHAPGIFIAKTYQGLAQETMPESPAEGQNLDEAMVIAVFPVP